MPTFRFSLPSLFRMSASLILLVIVCLSGCGGGGGAAAPYGLLPSGTWGGAEVTTASPKASALLVTSTSGGQLQLSCESPATWQGAPVLDSHGRFSVIGTVHPCCAFQTITARFDGVVSGNTITLTLTNLASGAALGTYFVALGQPAGPNNLLCPG